MSGARRIFVSYTTVDLSLATLTKAAYVVSALGEPFIDGLAIESRNPQTIVEARLDSADAFCAIMTGRYLSTDWTRHELVSAVRRGSPLYQVDPTNWQIFNFPESAARRLLTLRAVDVLPLDLSVPGRTKPLSVRVQRNHQPQVHRPDARELR